MIRNIGQIALLVDDIEKAIAFYRDKLKLAFLFSAPPKLAFFEVAGLRLMLSEPEGEGRKPENSTIYFSVDDIDATYRELELASVDIVGRPQFIAKLGRLDLWMFFIRDASGNLLGLMQEKAP